ncbi:hypothetical protein BDN72DRAFT_759902 [Pluteus cervinus]|uniref:Uncharacterized protein n=1 Tax=Pluteus cervinus TaxID=181527 RepID=A0ACD3BA53_9AGAR|nr:hypothetical protein BDN72DRAFT_759902 [Pluteus cervinus]
MAPNHSPGTSNLLKYHRPKLRLKEAKIPTLSQESKQCLRNLVAYRPPKARLPVPPTSRRAAVLVALFVGRMGDLYVLLSRRSATLRTYAGDTSLPGGRMDEGDVNVEDTARREAFEEIGLPRDRRKVPLLCLFEPFLAGNDLIVTPVVVLILDNTLRPMLNAAEVTSLFSHPLVSFLSSVSPFTSEPESVEVKYHTHVDHSSTGPNNAAWTIRMHRFLTGREAGGIKPVFGLTAAMLIRVATVGYARTPDFEVQLAGSPSLEQRIAWALYSRPTFRQAFEHHRIQVDWPLVKKIAGIREDSIERQAKYDHSPGKGIWSLWRHERSKL